MLTELSPGASFAGYEIEELAGRGGMGVVYRAYDRALERRVALKLLAPELSEDEHFRQRFLRETRLAASLDHPHVLPVYAAGEEAGGLYLVLRFVEGEDLKSRLGRSGTLEPEEVVRILGELASALDAAHERGLVHRDVKPANVLLDRSGEAYLADFGLTKPAASASGPTRTGELVGTLAYLAPEQIRGGPVDGRADQYALGCLGFQALTGVLPFERESEAQVLWAHLHDEPARLSEFRPELATGLDAVLRRALAKEPDDRFATCRAFAEAASEALSGRSTSTSAATAGDRATAFVGRERELAELLAGLDDAFAGRGRLFLLAGEPGIGKSRLAGELIARAKERGTRVLLGRCWEAGGAPAYWPWVQPLRAYVREAEPQVLRAELGIGASDVAQIVPEVREVFPGLPDPPSHDPEGARFRLFDAVATFLKNAAAGQPLVLVLDDLHAADAPSLLMLEFVTRELAGSRILVLGVYRDVDPIPRDPLTECLAELGREPVTRRIELEGLAEPDVRELIEQSAGVGPPPELVATILAETEGNPLFVGELVRLLAAEGSFEAARASARIRIPQTVRDVIGQRLRDLPDECSRLLVLASVLGREFGLEALERLEDVSGDELLEVLDPAVEARVVGDVPGSPNRMRFAHALIRDTLYEGIRAARRSQLHRRAGEALEELYAMKPEPHLAELAHHFLEAAPGGDVAKAVEYARRAADRAAAQLAFEEAARLYEAALATLALEGVSDDEERTELVLALGEAQSRAGDMPAAKASFLEAADLAHKLDLPDSLARAALGYGGRFLWGRATGDQHLLPLLEGGLTALGDGDSILRAKLLTRLGCALRGEPSRERRTRLSDDALATARRIGDPATLSYVLAGRYAIIWGPENSAQRLAIATELVGLAEKVGEKEVATLGHGLRGCALMELGDSEAAYVEFEVRNRLAAELKQPALVWRSLTIEVMRVLFEGGVAEAEGLIPEALRVGQRAQTRDALFCYQLQLYALRREQGRLGELEAQIVQAVPEYPDQPVLRCVLADIYGQLERAAEARDVLDSFADGGFTALPSDLHRLFGLSLLAEVAVALEDAPRAAVLSEELGPYADRVACAPPEVVIGSVSRYLGLLAATMGRLDDAERHFEAALEMNARMGAPPWVAHTQHDYARLLLQRGGPGDQEQARELLERCLATCGELGLTALERKASSLAELVRAS